MFEEKEESELLQSILFYRPSTRPQCTAPEHAYAARAMPFRSIMTLSRDNCYRALRATATEHGYIG